MTNEASYLPIMISYCLFLTLFRFRVTAKKIQAKDRFLFNYNSSAQDLKIENPLYFLLIETVIIEWVWYKELEGLKTVVFCSVGNEK